MKLTFTFFAGILLFYGIRVKELFKENTAVLNHIGPGSSGFSTSPFPGFSSATVDNVVTKAEAFKALLTMSQINTLQQTFTTTLAEKWSNLPCGSGCRNGIQFSSLTSDQLTAAKEVIAAAAGTAVNEGYDEFIQIVTADSILNVTSSQGAYGKGIYFISFLNEPTTTGAWMLQFGGHHYAANIAFNGGQVVGTTPTFEGVEPKSFTAANGSLYAPMNQERAGMQTMLASLSASQLASAKLSTTFSDVLLGPNQDGKFPATKQGLAVSTLSTDQKNLVLAAMSPWLADIDDVTGATLLSTYQNEINSTYISYASNNSAVAGDSSSFLKTNTDYVRIDGASVWIEFVCQTGVVFPTQIHYHTIYRDHTRDYGNFLANSSLPLRLLGIDVKLQGNNRIVSWITADETDVSHYDVQRSTTVSGDFTSIGQVTAKNGASNDYSFTDNTVITGNVIYYRLKMIDKDGYSQYSKVVAIKSSSLKSLAIYPNPARNTISIIPSQTAVNATVKIINTAGSVVIDKANLSGNRIDVDITRLAAGAYNVQVIENGSVSSAKIVKQ